MDRITHPLIDLVIPARNEQDNIQFLVNELPFDHLRHVVIADNASTDRTAQLARKAGLTVVHEPQRGYGAACLAGLAWLATNRPLPDIVAFLDADLADDPTLLPAICQPIADQKADLVIASRRRLAQPGALSIHQRFGNAAICSLIWALTGHRFTDLGPMRAIRWSTLQALAMTDRTWGWTVEMQYKAAVNHLSIQEIDVPYRPRRAGQSKISGSILGSARAAWTIAQTLAKLGWANRQGHKASRSMNQR